MIDDKNTILYVASNPLDIKTTDSYATLFFEGLKLSGLTFSEYLILDDRTKEQALEYVQKANVIFLCGGDTYMQNEFFKQLHLKDLLKNYKGIIIGQSAGSLNMAEAVYNSPENGNSSEPIYFEGLGLSDINIEPHFVLDTTEFDEMQIYQRNHQLEESKKRSIYALCDGSHILQTDESIVIYGKAFLIKDGSIIQICDDKQEFNINLENKKLSK